MEWTFFQFTRLTRVLMLVHMENSLQLKSEDSVYGVDNPVADRQVKIHHKSLIVKPRLKKAYFHFNGTFIVM